MAVTDEVMGKPVVSHAGRVPRPCADAESASAQAPRQPCLIRLPRRGFLTLSRDDGEGNCRANGVSRRRQCRVVLARRERPPTGTLGDLGARQGPSQRPRQCENCGLGHSTGTPCCFALASGSTWMVISRLLISAFSVASIRSQMACESATVIVPGTTRSNCKKVNRPA